MFTLYSGQIIKLTSNVNTIKKILDEGFERVGKIILVTINLHFREQKMKELFTQKTIQKEQKCFRRSFAES